MRRITCLITFSSSSMGSTIVLHLRFCALVLCAFAGLPQYAAAQIYTSAPVVKQAGGGLMDENDNPVGNGLSYLDFQAHDFSTTDKFDLHVAGDWTMPFPRISNIHGIVDTNAAMQFTVGNFPVQIDNFQLTSNAKWVFGGGDPDPNAQTPSAFAEILCDLYEGTVDNRVAFVKHAGISSGLVGNGLTILAPTISSSQGAYVLAPNVTYTVQILAESDFSLGLLGDAPTVSLTNEFGGALGDSFAGYDVSFTWHTVPEPDGCLLAGFAFLGLVLLARLIGRRGIRSGRLRSKCASLSTVLAVFSACYAPCSAGLIFDNLSGDYAGVSYFSTTTWQAARFTTDAQSYELSSIEVGLGNQAPSSDSGTVQLRLFNSTPGGTAPSTDTGEFFPTHAVTAPPYVDTNVTFHSSSDFMTLAANSTYWVVLSEVSGDGGIGWTSTFTMPSGIAGEFGRNATGDSGANWVGLDTLSSFRMRIDAVALIPEPATLALSGSALLVMSVVGWCRRSRRIAS